MINLYHPLSTSRLVSCLPTMTIVIATVVATLCYGRGNRFATVVATVMLRLWHTLSATLESFDSSEAIKVFITLIVMRSFFI